MKLKAGFVVAFALCCAVTAFGQPAEIPLPPPATDTIAPNIPGVVKGGTKVQVIVDGLKQTDGPSAMADGTLLYWDLTERRIGKVAPDGRPSTFLSNTDGSSAIGFDSKGRLIAILNGTPNRIGVIWPTDSKTILPTASTGSPSRRSTISWSTRRMASTSRSQTRARSSMPVRVRRSSRCLQIPSSGSTASHSVEMKGPSTWPRRAEWPKRRSRWPILPRTVVSTSWPSTSSPMGL